MSDTQQPTTQPDGTREWWVDGKLHRLDGPAVEDVDGTRQWCVNGERHRLDGPAIEYANGARWWWVNGELHRLDGPAVEYANGFRQWWIDGRNVLNSADDPTGHALLEQLDLDRLHAVLRLHSDGGPAVADLIAAITATSA